MIAAVEGVVMLSGERFSVVDTGNGVSYRIFSSAETLRKLPKKGEKIKLFTHLYQRENTQELYGFLSYSELDFFETLIEVSGIGPRSAIAIMGVAPVDALRKAIAAGDTSYLTKVSGIGRKTAGKVVLELRDKLAGSGVSLVESPELKEETDALEALITLGYSQSEARGALGGVARDVVGAAARVKAALANLGRR